MTSVIAAASPSLVQTLQPFEDATLGLRRRTPSPAGSETPPRINMVPSSGLSTRELQALYKRQSTAFPMPAYGGFDSRKTSFDSPPPSIASTTGEDEPLHPPNVFYNERPLDTAKRHSASFDKLPLLRMPKKTIGPDADMVFGLDIRDAFGWSFEDSTPYDVLLPSTPTSSAPSTPYRLTHRGSSTPSLVSSPAASSATMSTLSSIHTPATPGPSYASDYAMGRRRVSSMGDPPLLQSAPAPQPIPLGKSRMNNELQYDYPADQLYTKRPFMSVFSRQPKSPKPHSSDNRTPTKLSSARRAQDTESRASSITSRSKSALSLTRLGRSPKMSSSASTPPMPTPPLPSKGSASRERANEVPAARKEAAAPPTPRSRPVFSMGGSWRSSKAASSRSLPTSTSMTYPSAPTLAPAPGLTKPVAPVAPVLSKPLPLSSPVGTALGDNDPRLSKRQSQDLLYKRPSNPSLRRVAQDGGGLSGLKNSSQTSLSSSRTVPSTNKPVPAIPESPTRRSLSIKSGSTAHRPKSTH